MNRAWLKLTFSLLACFFLIGYGTCFAQTDQTQGESEKVETEGTQTANQQTATPAQQPKGGDARKEVGGATLCARWSSRRARLPGR